MNDVLSIHNVDLVCCDETNFKGRTYPKSEIDKVINSDIIKDKLARKVLFGYFNPTEAMMDDNFIDITRVSHVVDRFWFEDKLLKATICVLNTPDGRKLDRAFKKANVYAFLDGIGHVKENGCIYDYNLHAVHCELKITSKERKAMVNEEVN